MAGYQRPKVAEKLSLTTLYENTPVFSKVISLLDEKKSYSYIIEYLESKELTLSKASLTKLKNKLETSRETGEDLGELLQDKRSKKKITQVPKDRIEGYVPGDDGLNEGNTTLASEQEPVNLVTGVPDSHLEPYTQEVTPQVKERFLSTSQVYEKLIQKGLDTLNDTSFVDLPVLLKSLEAWDKNHKELHGLSLNALKQYQLITNAKLQAMTQIVTEYIPEEKQKEALERMSQAEDKILNNLEKTKSGRSLIKALKEQNIDL